MTHSLEIRTPAQILTDDIPLICCCNVFFFAAFIGLGALGGFLWFRRKEKQRSSQSVNQMQ
jgi:hypothetical protein